MLPVIPTVRFSFIAVDFSRLLPGGLRAGLFIRPSEQNEGCENGQQSAYAAKEQRQSVDQATACSGNQSFLGHRSVPRIALFTSNNSTIRGKGSMAVMEVYRCGTPWQGREHSFGRK